MTTHAYIAKKILFGTRIHYVIVNSRAAKYSEARRDPTTVSSGISTIRRCTEGVRGLLRGNKVFQVLMI